MVVNTLAALLILFYLYDNGIISIAFINGEPITVREAARVITSGDSQSELDRLIAKKLIEYEAKRQKIIVTKDEIRRQVYIYQKEALRQGKTIAELMQTSDQNLGEIDENVKLQITIYKIVAKDLEPTDEDLDEYFEKYGLIYTDEEKVYYKEQVKQFIFKDKVSQNYESWINEAKASSEVRYIINY